jgi:hypothetical protein
MTLRKPLPFRPFQIVVATGRTLSPQHFEEDRREPSTAGPSAVQRVRAPGEKILVLLECGEQVNEMV